MSIYLFICVQTGRTAKVFPKEERFYYNKEMRTQTDTSTYNSFSLTRLNLLSYITLYVRVRVCYHIGNSYMNLVSSSYPNALSVNNGASEYMYTTNWILNLLK